jgi:endonuclease YncB( thermonuclease family)
MWDMVGAVEVACEVYGRDRYERALAVCLRGDGLDLNGELVRLGYALAWYPATDAIYGPDYELLQAEAREAGRGM